MVLMNHSISEKENISGLTDAEIQDLLLQKIADNDMDALRDLYEQVSAAVYTYALSIVQNPTTAEDVMQESSEEGVAVSEHLYLVVLKRQCPVLQCELFYEHLLFFRDMEVFLFGELQQ